MGVILFDELQLKFDLDIDEVAEDVEERAISFEEARQISEAARAALDLRRERDKSIPWWDDYMRLIQQGWPWRVGAYIAWASSPKIKRWPGTLKELATEILGLGSPRTIYNWRNKHLSIDTVVSMMQAAPLFEHRREIITALVAVAIQPDYKSHNDRKLALEMLGDYLPKSKLELGRSGATDDISNLSDDVLARISGKLEEIEDQGSENDDPG